MIVHRTFTKWCDYTSSNLVHSFTMCYYTNRTYVNYFTMISFPILKKVDDHMKKCCNICHTPIDDENKIIVDNSNTFYHRHCYNFTIDNYCKVEMVCTFKNIKKKFSSLKNKVVDYTKKIS